MLNLILFELSVLSSIAQQLIIMQNVFCYHLISWIQKNWIVRFKSKLRTYVIGHYNPSVRIIDLVSHATYVVYVNFRHKWRDLQFKVDSERQIFWETFHGSFNLLSEFLPEICWEEIAEEILFVSCFDVWSLLFA